MKTNNLRLKISRDVRNQIKAIKSGGGVWDAKEEFKIYKKQIGDRYSDLQWDIITNYFKKRLKELNFNRVKGGN